MKSGKDERLQRRTGTLCLLVPYIIVIFHAALISGDQEVARTQRVLVGHTIQLDCYPPVVSPETDVYIVQWKKQGSPSPAFLWRRGQADREGRGYEGRVALVGKTSLSIVDARQTDEGLYDCQVWDVNGHPHVNGTTFAVNVLDVLPKFTKQPRDVLIEPGGTAEFECSVEPPPLTIKWLLDGRSVHAPDVTATDGRLLVKVNRDPRIHQLQQGEYRCIAEWESAALVSNPSNLTIAGISEFRGQETIKINAMVGGYAVIPGSIPHSVPEAMISVKHNGTILPPSSLRTILMPSGNFHVQDVQFSDAGRYQFAAQNPLTQQWVTARSIVILAVTASDKNSSAQLLAAQKESNVATLGANVSLECAANGSPPPRISWNKYGGHLPIGRYRQILGNLFLYNLRPNDTGTYVCQAENVVGLPVSTIAALDVLEAPEIQKWTSDYEVREREELLLDCLTKGHSKPQVKWMHNGTVIVASDVVLLRESRLSIRNTNREHAGFYQCFVANGAGYAQAITLVRVIPRSAPTEDGPITSAGGQRREHSPHVRDRNWGLTGIRNTTLTFIKEDDEDVDKQDDFSDGGDTVGVDVEDWSVQNAKRNRKKNRKKQKRKKNGTEDTGNKVVMIPPTRPEVTKLTDESVMVRWDVPVNTGLPILFFKVQYKDVTKHSPRWMTIDEDIPPHVLSYEVLNLRTGHTYRFRIAAVYSNNDNKLGPNSLKFLLQKDPPMKKPIVGPTIVHAEAIAPSAISVDWQYLDIDEVPIEGFFIYYRATTSAGHYTKITVLGANTLTSIISHLLPETAYDIKMQCFNSAGTSDFSNIHTIKTLSSPDSVQRSGEEPYPTRPIPVSNTASSDKLLYTIFGTILGILTLALVIFITYCSWKQRKRQKRRAINLSKVAENGSSRDLGKYSAVNGTPAANGHATGNGMFLWDKIRQIDENVVVETSLVEVPPRSVQNNNNEENVVVLDEEDRNLRDGEEVDLDSDEYGASDREDEPAACHLLIHRSDHGDGVSGSISSLKQTDNVDNDRGETKSNLDC